MPGWPGGVGIQKLIANRMQTMRWIAVLAMTTALSAAGGEARQRPQQEQPAVTFKVDVNFVEIDAIVTDPQGRFVRDLTRADFELLEDGVPQTISTFTVVDLPVERADPPHSHAAPIDPDVRSNLQPFNGRVFVIVLDDLHTDIRRTPLVRAAAKQFVRRYLGANDLVAVIHTGSGASSGQDFTGSQARLVAAIDRFAGRKLPSATQARLDDYYRKRGDLAPPGAGGSFKASDEYDQERAHFARNTLDTLRTAAHYLGNIHGRRKAVVWFGEGVDFLTDDFVEAKNASIVMQEMRDAIAAAARAGVSFYAFDARGVGAGLDEALSIGALPDDATSTIGVSAFLSEVQRAQQFLKTMSEETGGFAAINQNDLNTALERVVRENSSYYLLGYYPSKERRDGKFRPVQVRVKRPGLNVRSRGGYTAPKAAPPAPPSIAKDTGASAEVKAALESPLPVSGLGLTMTAAPLMGQGRKTAVAIVIEVDPQRLSFAEKNGVHSEEIEIVILPLDASGKPHEGARDQLPMNLSQGNYERVRTHGVRTARHLELSPGRYQLRVAARARNSGAVGSLLYDLDLPDFTRPPLAISGLSLTSRESAQIPTPAPEKEFLTLLPAVPTARREFARSDTVQLLAEVYDNRASTPHRVTIQTRVTADDGRAVFSASAERRSEEIKGGSGGYGHVVDIPLAQFPPGRYVLRVDATSTLAAMAPVFREIEFRVR